MQQRPPRPQDQNQSLLKISVNEVILDVVVTDKKGNPTTMFGYYPHGIISNII
jgi:hypothetical protein